MEFEVGKLRGERKEEGEKTLQKDVILKRMEKEGGREEYLSSKHGELIKVCGRRDGGRGKKNNNEVLK